MRETTSNLVGKRTSQVASKDLPRKQRWLNTNSLFLIDGKSPIQPYPQLAHKTTQFTSKGPGRHRLVNMKGFLMALIDEIYPPLVCPECYQISSGRSEADQHLKVLHHGRKIFQCVSSTCEQAYSTKAGLRYHLEHAHQVTLSSDRQSKVPLNISELPSFLTPQNQPRKTAAPTQNATEKSNKRFKKDLLPNQLQKALDNIYPMTVCPSCKEVFNKKTQVITHLMDNHHGEQPYQCVVIGCRHTKRYATREGLLYHLGTCHHNQ